METVSEIVKIIDGPSEDELFNGLRFSSEKRLLSLAIEKDGKKQTPLVLIQGIETEGNSGNSWKIKFSISNCFLGNKHFFINLSRIMATKTMLVEAIYSTQTREGFFTIKKEVL